MKIVEICYDWPAETFIQRHVEALRDNGIPIVLIARSSGPSRDKAASISDTPKRIPARIFPNFDHLSLDKKIAALCYLILSPRDGCNNALLLRDRVALAFFRLIKPDLIHFHTATLAATMNWIPLKLGIHYTVSVRGSDIQVAPLKSNEDKYAISSALKQAAGIHANYSFNALTASRLSNGPLHIKVIYTAVPIPNVLPSYSPDESDGFHFVAVQRLHWTKAITDILFSFRILMDQGFPSRLTIVGNGPDEARLRYWVNRLGLDSRVKFTGKLGYDTIRLLLLKAHACIQSFVVGGISNSLIEALALGCPAFVTSSEQIEHVIQDDENGILLPPFVPSFWPERLRLVQDRDFMEQLRIKGHDTARQLFSLESHAFQFASFYEQVLSGGFQKNTELYPTPLPTYLAKSKKLYNVTLQGNWVWQSGADLVLRALAQVVSTHLISVLLIGTGPQEDELRYLVHILGFAWWDIVPELGKDRHSDLIIRLPDTTQGHWQIEVNRQFVQQVPYGDSLQLSSLLEKIIKTQVG